MEYQPPQEPISDSEPEHQPRGARTKIACAWRSCAWCSRKEGHKRHRLLRTRRETQPITPLLELLRAVGDGGLHLRSHAHRRSRVAAAVPAGARRRRRARLGGSRSEGTQRSCDRCALGRRSSGGGGGSTNGGKSAGPQRTSSVGGQRSWWGSGLHMSKCLMSIWWKFIKAGTFAQGCGG